jgi:hypothetical protein
VEVPDDPAVVVSTRGAKVVPPNIPPRAVDEATVAVVTVMSALAPVVTKLEERAAEAVAGSL